MLGLAVRTPILLGGLGVLGAAGLWFAGINHVNSNFRPVYEAFHAAAEQHARHVLGLAGEDVDTHTLRFSWGGNVAARPLRYYEPTVIVVGESSVAIYDDATLDLKQLSADIGGGTRELFYDQISSVNFEAPHFQIKMADGETLSYRSTRKPDDVLYHLQERVRSYKAA